MFCFEKKKDIDFCIIPTKIRFVESTRFCRVFNFDAVNMENVFSTLIAVFLLSQRDSRIAVYAFVHSLLRIR